MIAVKLDQRQEQVRVSKTDAYLITDSRYWAQAEEELDAKSWHLIRAGDDDGPVDWIDWLPS